MIIHCHRCCGWLHDDVLALAAAGYSFTSSNQILQDNWHPLSGLVVHHGTLRCTRGKHLLVNNRDSYCVCVCVCVCVCFA
jgi:hypothetical protein